MRKCKQKFAWLLSWVMFFSIFSPSYARNIMMQSDDGLPPSMSVVTNQTTSAQVTTTSSALTLDKTELELWISKAQQVDQSLYTKASVKVLEEALEKALALSKTSYNPEEDTTTQEAINQAVLELQKAIEGLVQKGTGRAILSIERSTLGQPFYMEPRVIEFTEGENVAQALVRELGEGNYEYTGSPEDGFYLSQVLLKDDEPVNVPQCILDYAGKTQEELDPQDDEWLGEFDHTFMSGWIYWVNHVHMPYGMSGAILEDGDVVRLQFTVWGYGADLGLGADWNPDAPDYKVANKDALITELAYVNEDKSILETNPAVKRAYDQAIELVYDLLSTQEDVDAAVEVLKHAQTILPTDKTKLEALLAEAKNVDQSLYTEESLEAFVRAIQTAEKVVADREATQETIDAAAMQLKTSKAELVLKPVEVVSYEQALSDVLDTMYHNTPNPGFGTFDGEWTILSMARGGYPYSKDYVNGYYEKVEKIVRDKKGQLHKYKYTEYSRLVLALTAIGKDVTDVAGYNLLEYLADFDKVIWQGINGPTFALIALDTHQYDIPVEPNGKNQTTRDKLIEDILKQEISGGGFALMGTRPDVDITAMVLQALAPYQDRSDVKPVVERAVALLSKLQNQEGGYENAFGGADGGAASTSESTSQVIVALSALGIDPMKDERFIKNGKNPVDDLLTYYVKGQGFKHLKDGSVDAMATDQAAYALIAYDRLVKGQNRLYDMTDVEIIYADKAALEALIKEAKLIQNEDYTSVSWAYFKESLAHAEAVYKEVTAKQPIVDEAEKILRESIEKLEVIPIEEVPIRGGKVQITPQNEEKFYQITIDERQKGPITVEIAEGVVQKVFLNITTKQSLPSITVIREGNSLSISEGTTLLEAARLELFTNLGQKVEEEVKAQLLEQIGDETAEVEIYGLYEIGNGQSIRFNKPVTLSFKGMGDKSIQYRDQDQVLHPVSKAENVEGNLVVTSDHLSQFILYTVKTDEDNKPNPPTPPVVPDDKLYVTLSIDKLTIDKGYVIPPTKVEFVEGESVWDVLKREMDHRGIDYEYEWTEKYGSVYVQSIAGDGEFDHGRWSGWMYNVDGWYPNYGASKYILKDGEVIQWRYTTNLGDDLGIDNSMWDTYPDGTPKDPSLSFGKDGVLTNVPYPAKNYDYTIIEGIRIKNKDLRSYKDDADISPWAVNAIKIASALEIIEGSEGSFYPQKEVTRAEFTKMLAVLLDLEIDSVYTNTFEDVKFEDWYMPYVEAAYKVGLVQGDGKKFNPENTITREEMAVMLTRIMELEEVALEEPIRDKEESAPWAMEAIEKVYSNGLMTGRDQYFYPKAKVTREMATVALVRIYKKINHIVPSGMSEEVKNALDTTTDYLLDTVKEPTVGSIGGEWAIFGLARRGAKVPSGYYEDYYKRVEEIVKQEEAKTERKWKTKVTETQRLAIALTAIGKDPENVAGINLVDYSWNKEKNMADLSENDRILGNRQGLNELVFGLITIDLQGSEQPIDATVSRDSIIYKILNTYTTQDGGFNLREHEVKADVDMTAMTLQALAPYYKEDNYDYVTEAIDQALETLSKKQKASGGFENDYGGADGGTAETSESTAQVIVALCALGIDPHTDPRFIKNGRSAIDDLMSYYVEGGGFKHLHELEVDQMATEQAYYALVAYERFVNGQSPIYHMMDVEKSR